MHQVFSSPSKYLDDFPAKKISMRHSSLRKLRVYNDENGARRPEGERREKVRKKVIAWKKVQKIRKVTKKEKLISKTR